MEICRAPFPNPEPKGKKYYAILPNPSSDVFSIANVEMFDQFQINSFYGELVMKGEVNQNCTKKISLVK